MSCSDLFTFTLNSLTVSLNSFVREVYYKSADSLFRVKISSLNPSNGAKLMDKRRISLTMFVSDSGFGAFGKIVDWVIPDSLYFEQRHLIFLSPNFLWPASAMPAQYTIVICLDAISNNYKS